MVGFIHLLDHDDPWNMEEMIELFTGMYSMFFLNHAYIKDSEKWEFL